MTVQRIRQHYYDKILARRREEGQFLYRFDQIRQALAENYREVRRIPSPGAPADWLYVHLLDEISVMEPNRPPDSAQK